MDGNVTIRNLDKLYDKLNDLWFTKYKEQKCVDVPLTKDEVSLITGAILTSKMIINMADDGK